MHALLIVSGLLLVLGTGSLALTLLRWLDDWAQRRDVQVLVLAMPVVSLGLGVAVLSHFASQPCFRNAPRWDALVGVGLPLSMGAVVLVALGLGITRLVLIGRLLLRGAVPADGALQTLADGLAARLGTSRARVLLTTRAQPLALTAGVWRPRIVLSLWMIEHLDARELEAVLAHELGHIARRDYLMIWLATMLRDAFCYLPTSRVAYRLLQSEKELACDDLAVRVTHRPLGLASALAKVWSQATTRPALAAVPRIAQLLTGADEVIEGRITRLMTYSPRDDVRARARLISLGLSLVALVGLLVLEGLSVALQTLPIGCAHLAWLG
ncbi:MAG: M56 family metallopeptidase [Ktedonobacterales bacterium]|nr:M56 family metallopeptidase [Ktedonobacterales bacterium]